MNIKLFVLSGLIIAASFHALASEGIIVPFRFAKGKLLFEKNCSSCHGLKLSGSDKGPPLIHAFYKPSHHGDSAFYRAGLKGVKAHHWKFGDMPPVKGMTEEKMKSIISFIRFYQQQKNLY